MRYSTSYIHRFLTEEGLSITDYFICNGLIMNLSEFDGKPTPMALVIEDDALNQACIDYLREKGARQFDSMDELESWISKL